MAVTQKFLLLEDGGFFLLEDGGKLIISEESVRCGGFVSFLPQEKEPLDDEDLLLLMLLDDDTYY